MDIEDLIDDEELIVTLSAKGYTKTVTADTFRSQGRGGKGVAGAKLRDDDYVTHILTTTAHAYLLFFSNLGRVYRLKAHEIPKKERTARGTAIVNLLQLQPNEHIQAIIDTRDYETQPYLFFATKQGQVKKTRFNEYDSSLRTGLIAINLRDGDELVKVIPTNGGDDILMVSKLGPGHPLHRGRRPADGPGRRRRAGHEDAGRRRGRVARHRSATTSPCSSSPTPGYGKRTKPEHFNIQGRGGQGVRAIKLTAKKGHVVAAFMVELDDEIFVINSGGTVIRMEVREITSQGRDATGVRVMGLDEGQVVAAVAPVLQSDDDVPDRSDRRGPARSHRSLHRYQDLRRRPKRCRCLPARRARCGARSVPLLLVVLAARRRCRRRSSSRSARHGRAHPGPDRGRCRRPRRRRRRAGRRRGWPRRQRR